MEIRQREYKYSFRQHLSNHIHEFSIHATEKGLSTASIYPGEDLLCYNVTSFEPSHKNVLQELLEEYRTKICTTYPDDTLNYQKRRLNFCEQDVITVFHKGNHIFGFCTAWNREFFGSNAVRVLNRFWHDPSVRRSGTKVVLRFPFYVAILQQMILLGDKYDYLFFTRPCGRREYWEKTVSDLLSRNMGVDWVLSPDIHLVCPNDADSSCWQKVIYTRVKDSVDKFALLDNYMRLDEWRERFK